MNVLTVLLYLFGNRGAILRVASSPVAVPVGILLVVSAAIARNHDQVLLSRDPFPLLGPLIFSLISGAWVLIFTCRAWAEKPFARSTEEGGVTGGFRQIALSFYGLFWMTAPIAWLYAIPVEAWYEPVTAARCNVALLTVVSLWRILLMSRVVSVIGGRPFLRSLVLVLLPASLEAIVVGLVSGILGKRIMVAMAGLRNSPAEGVTLSAYAVALNLSLFAFLISGLILWVFTILEKPAPSRWQPAAVPRGKHIPWIFLTLTALFWGLVSIGPQQRLCRSHEASQFAARKDWPGLVAFLSAHQKEDFAPAVVLPPSPWETGSAEEVPGVFLYLTPDTPAWIRDLYLDYLQVVLSQDSWYFWNPERTPDFLAFVAKLPGGTATLQRSAATLQEELGVRSVPQPDYGTPLMREVLKYSGPP